MLRIFQKDYRNSALIAVATKREKLAVKEITDEVSFDWRELKREWWCIGMHEMVHFSLANE